jgi:hypothetical protein
MIVFSTRKKSLYRVLGLAAAFAIVTLVAWRVGATRQTPFSLALWAIFGLFWLVTGAALVWALMQPWFTLELDAGGRLGLRRGRCLRSTEIPVDASFLQGIRIVEDRDSDGYTWFTAETAMAGIGRIVIAEGPEREAVEAELERVRQVAATS